MLDKELFFNKMDQLVASYPNWKLEVGSEKVMRFWYSKFENMKNNHFEYMVDKYIENETFNPTIAGLKNWDIAPRKSRDQIKHEQMIKEMGLLDD